MYIHAGEERREGTHSENARGNRYGSSKSVGDAGRESDAGAESDAFAEPESGSSGESDADSEPESHAEWKSNANTFADGDAESITWRADTKPDSESKPELRKISFTQRRKAAKESRKEDQKFSLRLCVFA